MNNKVLAYIESKDNKFKNSAFEVISEAKKLSENLNCEFDVLTVSDITNPEIKYPGEYGAKKIKVVDSDGLNAIFGNDIKYSHSAIAKVISEVASGGEYNLIILSATSFGKEIAPSISIKTDSAFCPDCIDLKITDGNITATKPVYAGKSYVDIKFNSEKILLTLRPNVFKAEKSGNENIEIESIDLSSLNITAADFKTVVKDIVIASEKLDVAEADRIVSGGRGMRAPENFNLIENLASSIGAAIGASRAVVDAGWRPHSEQVGQTGKTVSPSLYIACGISGAIQHLAGMSSAKCIVAINKDKDAPIFQVADFGIVGDVFEVLPALTEEFKKLT
jgi:electron transfer flavoprotein alpha subunit